MAENEKGEASAKPKTEKTGAKGGGKKKAEPTGPAPKYKREQPPRLRSQYDEQVKGQLFKEFEYSSSMEVPRLVKISLNMGLGRAAHEAKLIDSAVEELKQIAGQAPVVCKAKKDIANYKLRKGHKIGVMVTLRGERMWEFLDRLVNVALPRVRDFRGVSSKGFDGRGNYTLGIREQIIFPEIEFDKIDAIKGLNISIVTTAKTDNEGRALLGHLGMPFRQAPAQGQAV
ncbi:MAG: 50S ribosomal protein L5 [Myxococcales bacterium]|nr:50S ribosomal protein L5 [Myxococcales bacterium]